jgi:hypothetical protein
MSALIGLPFPINSVVSVKVHRQLSNNYFTFYKKGMVPLEYLSDDMLFKSHVALTNAQQLHASFEALSMRQRDRSLSWRFHPFEMLDESLSRDQIRDIKSYIHTGLYEESVCAKNVNSFLGVVASRNRIFFFVVCRSPKARN